MRVFELNNRDFVDSYVNINFFAEIDYTPIDISKGKEKALATSVKQINMVGMQQSSSEILHFVPIFHIDSDECKNPNFRRLIW